MKELRAVVNAVFLFLVFLLAWAFVVPGHTKGSSHGPRFLRMQVEELTGHRRHGPEKLTFSVPYGFVTGALRFASMGRIRRELDLHFDESVEAAELKDVWGELKEKPEGTVVERNKDGDRLRFQREGEMVSLEVSRPKDEGENESVTIRVPERLVSAFVSEERDLDVDSLLAELRTAHTGDLVDIQAKDAHVRIWVE